MNQRERDLLVAQIQNQKAFRKELENELAKVSGSPDKDKFIVVNQGFYITFSHHPELGWIQPAAGRVHEVQRFDEATARGLASRCRNGNGNPATAMRLTQALTHSIAQIDMLLATIKQALEA